MSSQTGSKSTYADNLIGTWVNQTQLFVTGGGGQHGSVVIPADGVDNVQVARDLLALNALLDIVHFDEQVSARTQQNVFSRRMEQNMANLTGVLVEGQDGCVDALGQTLFGDRPDQNLAIFTTARNDV